MTPPETSRSPARCLLAACILLYGGCATYTAETQAMRSYWERGDSVAAARAATDLVEKHAPAKDRLLLVLEQGTALRAAGDYAGSVAAFERAHGAFQAEDDGPDIRVSQLGAGILTNPAQIPYSGRTYDRIFAAVYNALNHLALGDPAAARVSLNRAYYWEQRAVEQASAKIEDGLTALNESRSATTAEAIEASGTDDVLASRLDYLSEYAIYAPYVNPFSVWLDGLYFLYHGTDGSDLERARKSFERLSGMVPGHPAVEADLTAASSGRGPHSEPLVYVIFETGQAPVRQAEVINVPLYLFQGDVPYFGIALPKLVFSPNYINGLEIEAGGTRTRTRTIANIDSVIATEFRDAYPLIFSRALISGTAKAIAQWGIQNAVEGEDEAVQAIVLLAGLLYQYTMNQADLRTWTTLPKELQVARIQRPPDDLLTIRADGGPPLSLTLEPGRHTVVYIQAQSRVAPLKIHQFALTQP